MRHKGAFFPGKSQGGERGVARRAVRRGRGPEQVEGRAALVEALDDAAKRGDEQLRKFEAANKSGKG